MHALIGRCVHVPELAAEIAELEAILSGLEQRNEEYAKQVGHMPSLRLAPIREP
jgi:hypothetical protein